MLDYVLLITAISIVLALLLYISSWNRIIGYLLSVALRVAYWNQAGDSIWIEIGSIHFSLIAGRILLKDLRYYTGSQTIKVVKGQVTWRYWLRAPALEEDMVYASVGDRFNSRSPCRIHLSVEGFEWFLYNRTSAYDNIISQMEEQTKDRSSSQFQEVMRSRKPSENATVEPTLPPLPTTSAFSKKVTSWMRILVDSISRQLPDLDAKSLLPFSFEALKGSIICGNFSTPNVLVVEFQRTEGLFGLVPSKSTCDYYKQMMNLKFENVSVSFAENTRYKEPQLTTGTKVDERIDSTSIIATRKLISLSFYPFLKLWRIGKLKTLFNNSKGTTRSKVQHIHSHPGSFFRKQPSRSMDDTPLGPESASLEYAIERKVLEAPLLELSYYSDAPGTVPHNQEQREPDGYDIGNGDTNPEWGVDLVVHGGFLRYGPWADRQRAELQRMFFPSAYRNTKTMSYLSPGDRRLWTMLKVFVELRDGTTLYIPFREASKNWQWDGLSDYSRPRKREAAWLNIKVGEDSTISYTMPMVVIASTYEPLLEVHLDTIAVSTSLNDIRVLTAETCRVRGNMTSPSQWNFQRDWKFAVFLRQPVLYLLREHINMLTDLGKDWASGPPASFSTWIPMHYTVSIEMSNYELNLYANDHNIIDKPLVREENALFTLRGRLLHLQNILPFTKYRPDCTNISFALEFPHVDLDLTLPRWSNHNVPPAEPIKKLARVGLLTLEGNYRFFAELREENIEQLTLDLVMRDVTYKAVGWSIRYFMTLQQNYLGSFTTFSTLNEYVDKFKKGAPRGDPIESKYRPGKSNVMQTEIHLTLQSLVVMLPAGIPGCEKQYSVPDQDHIDVDLGKGIILATPDLELQLRLHEHLMEMTVNIGCISGCVLAKSSDRALFDAPKEIIQQEAFFVQGINILANRLFGPPPRTATYVCNWEIDIGDVKGRLPITDCRVFLASTDAFSINFADPLDSPAPAFALPVDHDITFLKVAIDKVDLTCTAGSIAAQFLVTQGVSFDSNDLCGRSYRNVKSLKVPKVHLRILQRYGGRDHWIEAADCVFDIATDIYGTPSGWKQSGESQRAFVTKQDVLTGRTEFLYRPQSKQQRMYTRDGLYVGPLLLPRPRRSFAKSFSGARDSTGPKKTSSKQATHLFEPHSSDSEVDESHMEPDRLPCPITSHPFFSKPSVQSGDESMSSGDESDTGDLTEPDMSETSWSDETDDELSARQDSPAQVYAHHTRHFTADRQRPSRWAASSFKLVKDKRLFPIPNIRNDIDPPSFDQNGHEGLALRPNSDDGCDSNVVRLRCQSFDIVLTPLAASALLQLVEHMILISIGPEILIDSLLAQRIRSVCSPPPHLRHTAFSVQLSSVRIRCLQVPDTKGHGDQLPRTPKIIVATISVIGLQSEGETLQAEEKLRRTLSVSANSAHVVLDVIYPSESNTDVPRHNINQALEISLSSPALSMISRNVRCLGKQLTISLDHAAPRHVLAVTMAHYQPVTQSLAAYRERQRHYHMTARVRILRLLTWAKTHSAVDPSSTTQPSFLISTGKPSQLRKDVRIAILSYLRNCLHLLGPRFASVYEDQREAEESVSLDELVLLLESRLPALRSETEANLQFNRDVLNRILPPSPVDITPTSPSMPSGTIEIVFGRVTVSIKDPVYSPPCELAIGPLKLTACAEEPDLMQTPPMKGTKDLKTTRDKTRRRLLYVVFSLAADDVELSVMPHILEFAQHLVRLQRSVDAQAVDQTPSPESPFPRGDPELIYADVNVSLRHLRLQAAAERLILVYDASALTFASTVTLRSVIGPPRRWDISSNSSLVFDSISLAARSAMDSNAQDILASSDISRIQLNSLIRVEPAASIHVRGTVAVDGIRLSVPRSAIRLVKFVEEWRGDYLPIMETTIAALLSEVRPTTGPSKPTKPTRSSQKRPPIIQLQGTVSSIGVFLHVLPGTWLSWEVFNVVAYARYILTNSRTSSRSFGLQIASQRISITSLDASNNAPPFQGERIKLDLPSITITGHFGELGINALVSLGLFYLTVKPSYWDTLLSVQQKFGQDFNDLLHFIGSARRNDTVVTPVSRSSPSLPFGLHTVMFRLQGFQVGLEGHASTVYLECQNISGGFNTKDRRVWHTNVTGLALSLSTLAAVRTDHDTFNRNNRSVFLVMDVILQVDALRGSEKILSVNITKVHAVMQPSSIGEIGDFVDHLQAEVLMQKDERARELSDFKEKTRNVMRTFEVKARDIGTDDGHPSFLSEYAVTVTVQNIGAAFPLALDQAMEIPHGKTSHDHMAVQAFLFSIKSLVFTAERSGSGHANMQGFSFQFVDRFRQSVTSDFGGDNHFARNRLLYPEMTVQIRSEQSTTSRRLRIGANVSGFILDLDSSIPDYVFSLIDVYRRGKERLEKLALGLPRDRGVSDSAKTSSIGSEAPHRSLPTSNIILSLMFMSGKVRMHGETRPVATRTRSFHDTPHGVSSSLGGEVFNLPEVTVWGEYRASVTSRGEGLVEETLPSSLMMKSTVHSSENTLRPSLLPFLAALVHRVEERMRTASWRHGPSTSLSRESESVNPSESRYGSSSSSAAIQITFALRIDQSKLQLTCQPDVNVVAGINWDSGGFVVNVASHTRQVSFMGNVGGLTIGLKHGFLSEDCVRLDARDLTFSVTFSKHENSGLENASSSVSVVLDTEVSGGVRFSRLQDVLCFKAVWLDRIPVFSASSPSPYEASPKPTHSSTTPAPPKQELATAILLRVRRVAVEVDLGQSISFIACDIRDISVRTKLHDKASELSLSVGDISLKATGNIAGRAHLPSFLFETVRRTYAGQAETYAGPRMLDLFLKSGALEVVLESDYQKILQLWAEPFEVVIFDDWSQIAQSIPLEDRRLRLSFLVSGAALLVVSTVGTIPKLVSYSSRFMANLQAQREGASRESKAFRVTQSPKPDNPLSAVANAMIVSAGTKFKEAETGVSYVIRQEMNFSLKTLRLIVFPRNMSDFEAARFTVRDVQATLTRLVESDQIPATRELRLAFSAMNTSRLTQLNHAANTTDRLSDGQGWLAELLRNAHEASIFDMPSMTIVMKTDETTEHRTKVIHYDFDSRFVRSEGLKNHEDIYITLNVSLYSWLTLLRKNLSREMDQVQGSMDWRAAPPSFALSPIQPSNRLSSPAEGSRPDLHTTSLSPVVRSPSVDISSANMARKLSSTAVHLDEQPSSEATLATAGPRPPSPIYPEDKDLPIKSGASSPASESPALTERTPSLAGENHPTVVYRARKRYIERLNMRQLGEATPDVMHPFFMKKAGFNLEDSLPQYVHEYATTPVEEIIRVLLQLYSKQLNTSQRLPPQEDEP